MTRLEVEVRNDKAQRQAFVVGYCIATLVTVVACIAAEVFSVSTTLVVFIVLPLVGLGMSFLARKGNRRRQPSHSGVCRCVDPDEAE